MPAIDPLGHLRQIFEILVEGLSEYVIGRVEKCRDSYTARRELDAYFGRDSYGRQRPPKDLSKLLNLLFPRNDTPTFASIKSPDLEAAVEAVRQTRNPERDALQRSLAFLEVEAAVEAVRQTRNLWAHFQPIEYAVAEQTARKAKEILRQTATQYVSNVERLERELRLRLPVGLSSSTSAKNFWSEEHFEYGEPINERIWSCSADIQRSLRPPNSLTAPGAVGAQQAMIEDEDTILPWIPDLLGTKWRDEESIIVIGAAYSGIIKEYSTRASCLTLKEYKGCSDATNFQKLFLDRVVQPDSSYYGYIRALVGTENASHLAAFDLCRASFVRRGQSEPGPRLDGSPTQAIAADPAEFSRYVAQPDNKEWNWSRIAETQSTRMLCVGQVAEHGILRLLREHGGEIYKQESRGPFEMPDFEDKEWPLLNPDMGHSGLRWATEGGYWKVKLPDGKIWYIRPI